MKVKDQFIVVKFVGRFYLGIIQVFKLIKGRQIQSDFDDSERNMVTSNHIYGLRK